MRIAVLGTFLKDRIIDRKGKATESKGGLFYAVQALRSICAPEDEIIPISYVGYDFYDEVRNFFKEDRRVNLKGLFLHNGVNNCVELRYVTDERREERSLHPMPSLKASQLQAFLDLDVFIANFISGWEMQLAEFQTFASQFRGLMAIDIHSLTLERLANGLRKPRKLKNIKEWIEFPHIIQCNEREYAWITHLDLNSFYKMFCFNRNKIVNLTFGKHGSLHIFREKDKIEHLRIEAEKRVKVVDPTGCGDVFLAAFVYFYVREKSIRNAAKKANTLAAMFGSNVGLPELASITKGFNQLVG